MCMYMYAYWGRPYRYSLTAQLQGCSKDNTMFFKKKIKSSYISLTSAILGSGFVEDSM